MKSHNGESWTERKEGPIEASGRLAKNTFMVVYGNGLDAVERWSHAIIEEKYINEDITVLHNIPLNIVHHVKLNFLWKDHWAESKVLNSVSSEKISKSVHVDQPT